MYTVLTDTGVSDRTLLYQPDNEVRLEEGDLWTPIFLKGTQDEH